MLFFISSVLCYDIWFYVSHVLLHKRWFYAFHSEHHTKLNPTWLDTYVGHALEGPFQGVGMLLPCLLLPYAWLDLLFALLFVNARGMMRHDERFVWLIGNHHLLHHLYPQYNFGEYWIDAAMGTCYPVAAEYRKGLIYL